MIQLPDFYISIFIQSLEELSNFKYQQIVWEGRGKRHMSFYTELICTFFDDLMIMDFEKNDLPNMQISEKLKSMFSDFIMTLDKYSDNKEHYEWEHVHNEKFWIDPQWIKLSKMAKELLEQWGKEVEFVNKTTKEVRLDYQKVIQEAK